MDVLLLSLDTLLHHDNSQHHVTANASELNSLFTGMTGLELPRFDNI